MQQPCRLCLLLACLLPLTAALSDQVCNQTTLTWQSGSPHLTGSFPYYALLFTCEGDLNLESLPVANCVNFGANCGQPAADAFCRYLGFDACAEGLYTTVQADGPTRAMTGEWGMIDNEWAQLGYLDTEEYNQLQSAIRTGQWGQRLDSVSCFDSRTTLGAHNEAMLAQAMDLPAADSPAAPVPAPAPTPSPQAPLLYQPAAVAGVMAAPLGSAGTATGGRRLRGAAL